jgi:hypothetical protein
MGDPTPAKVKQILAYNYDFMSTLSPLQVQHGIATA